MNTYTVRNNKNETRVIPLHHSARYRVRPVGIAQIINGVRYIFTPTAIDAIQHGHFYSYRREDGSFAPPSLSAGIEWHGKFPGIEMRNTLTNGHGFHIRPALVFRVYREDGKRIGNIRQWPTFRENLECELGVTLPISVIEVSL